MKIIKKLSVVLLLLFLVYIGVIVKGFFSEERAHSLDLSMDVKGNDLCLYTNNRNHFLGKPDEETYFLVWVKPLFVEGNINTVDKQIFLKDRTFPFKIEDCILVPISLLELDKPYVFIIHTEKSFVKRACILRDGQGYRVKEVVSTENCDS